MKLSHCATNHLVACFDYQATEPHELTVSRGERLLLLDSSREWWLVQNENSQSGYVPSNYVKRVKHNFITSIRSAFREVLRRNEGDEFAQVTIPGRSASQQLTATRSDSNLNSATIYNRGIRSNALYLANRGDLSIDFQSDSVRKKADGTDSISYVARPFGTASTIWAGRLAVVLYSYVAQKGDELTLRRGDRVCVHETCADGWWRVQYIGELTQAGSQSPKLPYVIKIGWFPSNYLLLDDDSQPMLHSLQSATSKSSFNISDDRSLCILNDAAKEEQVVRSKSVSQRPSDPLSTNPTSPLAVATDRVQELRRSIGDREWYWASVRRIECERALTKAVGGSFLVRDCESSPGDLTIVVRRLDTQLSQTTANTSLCRNFCVRFLKPHFVIGSLKFDSVDALLNHYRHHPIFNADNEKLFLGQSLQRDRLVRIGETITSQQCPVSPKLDESSATFDRAVNICIT